MQEQTIGNNYDHRSTIAFIKKWKVVMIVVFVAAAIVSGIVSFLIRPNYRSVAVMIPSNSNRMSKAILAERYSMDFMDYGAERDCEYALQILTSSSMEDSVMGHFNLREHYEIKDSDPYKITKTRKKFQHKLGVKRTNNMGIEISILDEDPQIAADIANYMVDIYDTLCRRIHHDRAQDAYNIMQGLCDEEMRSLQELESNSDPKQKEAIRILIEDKCQNLADLQTRTAQAKVDMDQHINYKFSIDRAQPADKKYSPRRAIIVLGGSVGTLAVCILVLLLCDMAANSKRKEESC